MKITFFNYLTAGLIASGGVTIAPGTFARTAPSPKAEVEHLTCVKDAQGLMCKADDRDNTPAAQDESATLKPESAAPQIISSEQLGRFSNLLLGCLYFVLPTGLALAIFLHDKRSKLLSEQVERLEKLWSQNPQH